MTRRPRPTFPAVITDPTGEHHGIPTYHWRTAPPGLATRRQLAAQGLRKGGQPPVAMIRRGQRLWAHLYAVDVAKPQFTKTPAKLAAVHTAARARRRCTGPCQRTDLTAIPRQAAPHWGECDDCYQARESRLSRPPGVDHE